MRRIGEGHSGDHRRVLALGEHDKAHERLDACPKLEGKAASPLTWFALAACRHKLGKTQQARQALRNGQARLLQTAPEKAI